MGNIQLVLAISLFTPLITGLAVLLAVIVKICVTYGPIGGIITFGSAIAIAMAIIDGQTISINLWQIVPGIGLSFNVTALGALFGIVASGLWILASIYSVGYMREAKQKTKQDLILLCSSHSCGNGNFLFWKPPDAVHLL